MKFKKSSSGFTLIELIVTVVVIMVLTGVGAYSLNGFKGIKELESARNEISNHLKLARNMAITRQYPDGTNNLDYIRLAFSGQNRVTIAGVSVAGAVTTSSPYSSIVVGDDNDISITIPVSDGFGFKSTTGRLTDYDGLFLGDTMTVTVTKDTEKRLIIINDLGIITNVD